MFTEADNITDEEIFSTVQRLTDAGRPVSPVTVWSELRRGSIVSIAAALERWRDARQPAPPAAQPSAEMPQELADALMSAAHRLRQASWDEAHSAGAHRADMLGQRLQTALAERDEALAVYQQTEGDAANSRRQLEELMHALRASEEAVARLQNQHNAANERAEAAEARAGELAQRVSAQDAELSTARLSLDEERKAREAVSADLANKNEELARIAHERDEARQHHAASSQEVERLSQEAGTASARAETATAQANEGAARIAALEAELDAARHALASEREAGAAREAEASARDEALQRATRELDEARAKIDENQTRMSALESELAAQREASAAASVAHEALQHATRELDEARASIDESQNRIAALESELMAEREARAQHSAAASTAQEALQQATRELDEARAQINDSHARIAALESDLSRERETSAAQSAQASTAQEALQQATRELDEARARIDEITQEKHVAQSELARVTQEAAAAVARADEAQQHAASLTQQLAEREKSEAAMRDELRDHKIALQTAGAAKEEEIAALQRRISAQAQTHSKAYDELRGNAEQWVTYARDLKQRLDVANEKILFIDARSTGEVALLRRLSTELERLKPDHELVFREAQQKVIGEKIAQQLAQKGYRYDPTTAVMSKIEG
ncbi:DNA-binding protein [Caballeronia sp. GAFFF1]|uniref:DNA-binding protein n=1 Tax=Caballeronia sp. GAFFF1 TaxID=2921779 RepID=UPI0020278EC2|nr:DNA-binding protein [Caballeronia sp. GAFFF1]